LKRDGIYYKKDIKFEKYREKFELKTDTKNIIQLEIKLPEN